MKFLVDAQLPRRLVGVLSRAGHETKHTFDLSAGNRTTDGTISTLADSEGRVVVTKDSDFVDSFWLRKSPKKLLLVSTGNIPNTELLALFEANASAIESALTNHGFVELTRTALTVHA
ncbi:MAG: hypothetical protein D4R57_00520 [Verrucomicrobiales bacterium]|nr:MAG: hypothetical protein D4R57_00520 [Verrucomicrobiales bacterium]